jgi:hypothetical protein
MNLKQTSKRASRHEGAKGPRAPGDRYYYIQRHLLCGWGYLETHSYMVCGFKWWDNRLAVETAGKLLWPPVRSEVSMVVTEEWLLLGYKNPVRISQETHYVSATESSRLMLCNIWGFYGGDYEECLLVGYKNPFHTSQETHYLSATEHSLLMLCNIRGLHGGDYEECRLLGRDTVWLL